MLRPRDFTQFVVVLALVTGFASCAKDEESGPTCNTPVTGTKWVPSVPGASSSNHDSTVSESVATSSHNATLVGLDQAVDSGHLVSINIDVTQDLGNSGSITLQAKTTSMPSTLVGGAAPFLMSFTDSNGKEYVNMAMSGAGSCNGGAVSGHPQGTGIYDCTPSGGCIANAGCKPNWPSAFTSRDQWEQHQLLNSGSNFPSVNTFPTCNWLTAAPGAGNMSGSDAPNDFPKCAFAEATTPAGGPFLVAGKLPTGTYVAKYALVATRYAALVSNYPAVFSLTVVQKKTGATIAGAVDVNVILVGTTNVNASRTAKGQQNLNTLLAQVGTYYNQAGTTIKLGAVNAYEWPCEAGGDAYANVGTAGLGDMFANGSSLYPGTVGKALNIFLTSTITNDIASLGAGVVIDGYSGGIGGPVINGTGASGLVFATFDRMGENATCQQSDLSDCVYNPDCPGASATCALTEMDEEFWNMATTVTHEMGHYLGLNHPNESDGTVQDSIFDTPVCTTTAGGMIGINSCLHESRNQKFSNTGTFSCVGICAPYNSAVGIYCPMVDECSFNHIMWFTSKNFTDSGANDGLGDGNIFSPDSGILLNYSPFVQ